MVTKNFLTLHPRQLKLLKTQKISIHSFKKILLQKKSFLFWRQFFRIFRTIDFHTSIKSWHIAVVLIGV